MEKKNQAKTTLCIHAGAQHNDIGQGVVTPVYPSAAYGYLDTVENIYPRYYNTFNQQVVIDKLCALERGESGLLFSSGMAAISTVMLSLLKSGDHVIFQSDLYGGTHHFIHSELEKFGISFTFVNGQAVENFEQAIRKNTRIIYIETPSNPLLNITDIEGIAQLAKAHSLISVIDNTFASPVNQNPISLGIDVVIHSGTKYLSGHSDICFGAVITSGIIKEKIQHSAVNFGGSINATTAALIERSLKTLALRVKQQNENAMAIASALEEHPLVKQVNYPGLKTHPDHEIAIHQMSGFGGMLSFEPIVQGLEATEALMRHLKLIFPAMSLGGVETLICSPARTSHIKLTAEERKQVGVSDELLRISVGIEDVQELIADLTQALEKIGKPSKVAFQDR
jgi:cystathionine beta-lyase/cystathionine gamma-synthase